MDHGRRAGGYPTMNASPGKILIIQTAFIGDVVLATALVETIKNAFPETVVDFLLRKGNESLLHGHPLIRHVHVWDKNSGKYRNLLKMLQIIRKEKYDKVINVQRFFASGFLTAFSKARETVGFDKNPLSRMFNIRIPHQINAQTHIHEIERNHQLISHFISSKPLPPRLYPSDDDFKAVSSYRSGRYITISPASVWFTKQFPAGKWSEFLKTVPNEVTVYLLGGKSDRQFAEDIKNASQNNRVVNLAGQLSFLQSAALMQNARMNYVNDSAPLHFCSAMDAAVTAVYCSTVPAFGYGPLSARSFIVERRDPLYCRPCGLHGYRKCPQGHFKCANDISIAQLHDTLTSDDHGHRIHRNL
jgi:ADP-heptose:LPS heptosyltransferase